MKTPVWLTAALILAGLGGCSQPEHGHVAGVVTINGQPVEGAVITFSPKEGGRPAFGRTGADGSYELEYTVGVQGAALGVNHVYITTYVPPRKDDNGQIVEAGSPERIPPEYNEAPSIEVEVKPGENKLDFAITASQETYPRASEN